MTNNSTKTPRRIKLESLIRTNTLYYTIQIHKKAQKEGLNYTYKHVLHVRQEMETQGKIPTQQQNREQYIRQNTDKTRSQLATDLHLCYGRLCDIVNDIGVEPAEEPYYTEIREEQEKRTRFFARHPSGKLEANQVADYFDVNISTAYVMAKQYHYKLKDLKHQKGRRLSKNSRKAKSVVKRIIKKYGDNPQKGTWKKLAAKFKMSRQNLWDLRKQAKAELGAA